MCDYTSKMNENQLTCTFNKYMRRFLLHLTGRLKKPLLALAYFPVKDEWKDKAGEDGQNWHNQYALDVIRSQHDRHFNAGAFFLFIEVCH